MKLWFQEWKYWHISRKTEKFIPWVARKLPKKLKYFVVIAGMSDVFGEGSGHPEDITGFDLLRVFETDPK